MSRQTVDMQGNPIKLTGKQKDVIYKKAKELKSKISSGLCTHRELHDPTSHNVNKMLHSEMKLNKTNREFKDHMEAIGADPKDYSTERLRRR